MNIIGIHAQGLMCNAVMRNYTHRFPRDFSQQFFFFLYTANLNYYISYKYLYRHYRGDVYRLVLLVAVVEPQKRFPPQFRLM